MLTTALCLAVLLVVGPVLYWQRLRQRDRRAALRAEVRALARLDGSGDFARMEQGALAVLARSRGKQDEDAWIVLSAGQLLTRARMVRGRLVEAEADLTALLAEYGPHNRPHLRIAWQAAAVLAGVQVVRGRYDEAITLATKVADESARRWGPESALAMQARHQLGWCLVIAKRPEAAVPVLTEVLAGYARINGSTTGRRSLAEAHLLLGRLDEAEAAFHTELAELTVPDGPDADAVDTAGIRFALAKIAALRGQREAAVAAFTEVLEQLRALLGEDSPWTLETRYELAELSEGALKAHQAVLDDRIRVLGPDHPDTTISREAFTRHGG